jgi:DNA-binding NarL/FixJ family response regulator
VNLVRTVSNVAVAGLLERNAQVRDMEDRRIRILLADEQALFREAVRAVLESEPDLLVVAEARDGSQAVAEAERTAPDVAILEAALPNGSGIRATALIRERVPGCRILITSGVDDGRILVDALEAGASGFLSKSSPMSQLIVAARSLARGEILIPPTMLRGLLDRLIGRRREQNDALRLLGRLTRREKEVLRLLVEGADNDGIAQSLVISPQTARTHVQNVLTKLDVHSRLEAAAFVTKTGILDELAEPESLTSLH